MSGPEHPDGDPCPNCGNTAWDSSDQQRCGVCGTRVCPVCGADFAEGYGMYGERESDNLGDHLRQWHEGVQA